MTVRSLGLAPFRGARVKKSADQTAFDFTGSVNVSWDAEDFDTDGFHDNVTNNSRLTLPAYLAGRYIEIGCAMYATNLSGNNSPITHLRRNGVTMAGSQGHNPGVAWGITMSSGPFIAALNDYYEVLYQVTGDTSSDILASRSFFWLRVY